MKKEKNIRIVKVEPNQPPYVKEVGNNLAALQKEVGGLIEVVGIDSKYLLICNEESKINGMELNRRICDDSIAGPFFICGDTGDEFKSLDDVGVHFFMKYFKEIPEFSEEEKEMDLEVTVTGFDW